MCFFDWCRSKIKMGSSIKMARQKTDECEAKRSIIKMTSQKIKSVYTKKDGTDQKKKIHPATDSG